MKTYLLKTDRKTALNCLVHILILSIVFILPEVIFSIEHSSHRTGIRHLFIYSHTLILIITFYINYFSLIDRFLFRKKWHYYLLVSLILALSMTLMEHCLIKAFVLFNAEMSKIGHHFRPDRFFPIGMLTRDFVMIVLTTALSVALKMGLRWANIEKMNDKMQTEKKEMELRNLKSQLNPHFLFNTLNNIYALTAIDSEKAQNAIHQLSKLLRYTLYENESKEVTLEKELSFIRSYIELMKLRLSEHNRLSTEIHDGPDHGLTIAPMLIITLIENAFKHGGSSSTPSLISIRISLDNSTLLCHIENTNIPKTNSDKTGSGIGLANLQRQLSLLYPERHSYSAAVVGDRYVAELSLILNSFKKQDDEPLS